VSAGMLPLLLLLLDRQVAPAVQGRAPGAGRGLFVSYHNAAQSVPGIASGVRGKVRTGFTKIRQHKHCPGLRTHKARIPEEE